MQCGIALRSGPISRLWGRALQDPKKARISRRHLDPDIDHDTLALLRTHTCCWRQGERRACHSVQSVVVPTPQSRSHDPLRRERTMFGSSECQRRLALIYPVPLCGGTVGASGSLHSFIRRPCHFVEGAVGASGGLHSLTPCPCAGGPGVPAEARDHLSDVLAIIVCRGRGCLRRLAPFIRCPCAGGAFGFCFGTFLLR